MTQIQPATGVGLLAVRNLSVSFDTPDGTVEAVRGVSFDVKEARTLGIVGESGSGKSVTTQAIVGLTRGARITGQALLRGAGTARDAGSDNCATSAGAALR